MEIGELIFASRVYTDFMGVPTLGYGYTLLVKKEITNPWILRETLATDLAVIGISLSTDDFNLLEQVRNALNSGSIEEAQQLILPFTEGENSAELNQFDFPLISLEDGKTLLALSQQTNTQPLSQVIINGELGSNSELKIETANITLKDSSASLKPVVATETPSQPAREGGNITLETSNSLQITNSNDSSRNLEFGTLGADEISSTSAQLVFGGAGADVIEASTGTAKQRLYGGDDGDTIVGGNDARLFGGEGNDILEAGLGTSGHRFFGGIGDDQLLAGIGGSLMVGGAGADEFWIARDNIIPLTANLVTDFVNDTDTIVVSLAGVDDFTDLELVPGQQGTLIQVAGQTLALILGVGVTELDSTDFRFEEPEDPTFTIRWIDADEGFWDEANKWDPSRLPQATDDVLIDLPSNPTVTHRQDTTTRINRLKATNPLIISDGILDIATIMEIDTTVELAGGTLANAIVISLSENAEIVVTANSTLDGLTSQAPLTVNNGQTLTANNEFSLEDNATLDIQPNGNVIILNEASIAGIINADGGNLSATGVGVEFTGNRARLSAANGAEVTIAAPSYSSAGLPSISNIMSANGADTELNLSALRSLSTQFDDGTSDDNIHTITATDGGQINLSQVETLTPPTREEDEVNVVVVGTNSSVDLSALKTIEGVTVNGTIRGITRFLLQGGSTAILGRNITEAGSYRRTLFQLSGGSQLTADGTQPIAFTSTSFPLGREIMSATGTNTELNLPSFSSWDGGFNDGNSTVRTQTVTASEGAAIDLSGLQTITTPARSEDGIQFVVNSSAQIDLSSLQTVDGVGGLTFDATDGSLLLGDFTNRVNLTGIGTIDANTLTNDGLLNPDTNNPDTNIGTLTLNGDYTQTGAGTLNIQLGGTNASQFDVLAISGTATFDGTLDISLVQGYTPQLNDSFQIITFGQRSGTSNFANLNFPTLEAGLAFQTEFNTDSLTLSVVAS